MSSSARIAFFLLPAVAYPQPPADLREAARLDQAGRCAEAEPIYQRALARGKPAAALLNNAGNHYVACGDPAKARNYFEQLAALSPNHPNANLQLARLELAAGEFSQAEQRLEKLAASLPPDFGLLLLLGRAAGRAGHYARAVESLEAAIRLKPEDPAAALEAGLANAAAGNSTRAVFLLARAQREFPSQPGIALALARAAEDAGYFGDAAAAYGQYLARVPADQAARRDRARALAMTVSGHDEGLRELSSYVARNPRDPLGHFYAAQAGWESDADAALARLAKAIELDAKLAPAHVARAWLLNRLGRSEEALPHLESALKIAPNQAPALDLLGAVLLSLDRAKDAEAPLRAAAKIAPTDAGVALHLGRALIELGRDDEGQQWLDKYRNLRPARQRSARREAGMIELATLDPAGQRAREIERFRAMAKSRPDDPLLQANLAGLLLADGQRDEALREYRALAGLNGDTAIWAQAGRALSAAGELEAARPFLERAGLRTDPAAAAIALARKGKQRAASDLLDEALRESPSNADLHLSRALVAALGGDTAGALERLRRVESRWPDWDRPWIAEGLLLQGPTRTARLRTAVALGAPASIAACENLQEWISGGCGQ
ncbi:MAG: tetratricopeptide repeat protein [Bryobacteraceae bacterium]